jgi:hypothetical protein
MFRAFDLIAWYGCQYKHKGQKERKDNLRVWKSAGGISIFKRSEGLSLILRHTEAIIEKKRNTSFHLSCTRIPAQI